MSGHVFILQGDLTKLACDAWLLPTSRSLEIRSHWLRGAPTELLQLVTRSKDAAINDPKTRATWRFDSLLTTPPGWKDGNTRSFDLSEWPTDETGHRPWATQVVVDSTLSVDEQARRIADGAVQFVERSSAALVGKSPSCGRAKHLLALPVVGTGHGGGWAATGAILRELIVALTTAVSRIDADVALVTHTPDQFAASQHARRQVAETGQIPSPWQSLPVHLVDLGRTLAERNRHNQLVLFLGAGVSMSAGLPSWKGILSRLATSAGFDHDARTALEKLPAVDQARLVQDRMGRTGDEQAKTGAMAAAICEQVIADRYGLAHALLANLPVAEAVTTSYDTLFESASNDAGYLTAILPYESIEGKRRWLLKMHGCVNHPQDIVLTREDFLRYAERRGALAAIVQAMLITRHMVFVGFSLSDDNFLRIADEVRKVVRDRTSETEASSPFGTAIMLNPSPLLEQLWKNDIAYISVLSQGDEVLDTPESVLTRYAANQLEILLDFVVAEANQDVSHLLGLQYDDLLTADERELRNLVRDFSASATPGMKALPAWRPVADMLRALGATTAPSAEPEASRASAADE